MDGRMQLGTLRETGPKLGEGDLSRFVSFVFHLHAALHARCSAQSAACQLDLFRRLLPGS